MVRYKYKRGRDKITNGHHFLNYGYATRRNVTFLTKTHHFVSQLSEKLAEIVSLNSGLSCAYFQKHLKKENVLQEPAGSARDPTTCVYWQ